MLLEVNRVTRTFVRRKEEFAAVDEVSFHLDAGSFVALVGRSGNGKTTLLNMITGLLRPTDGTVKVNGEDLTQLDDEKLSRLRNRTIGYVTQRETLISGLSVFNNVMLPALMHLERTKKTAGGGEPTREDYEKRAEALLRELQVEDLADSYPRELSGGEIRRVAIARALVMSPKLFIADEPTGDLDADSTKLVMQLLRRTADEGAGVIMVTHDSDAIGYADRVYHMDRGRLLPSA
ncbi:MAG: ABC transporter ATP-binding protein [Actinomycetaceae bacterium]|nr:ABC transporter ATP-binding protein [Actinomycetaceae bacterium]